ncbi:MAG: hypothetical protein K2W95_18800 [Candidatus Obscuribacterales bacterium]|nr:hypothetical protein [Candidatus Obscuribacterales bacterium]
MRKNQDQARSSITSEGIQRLRHREVGKAPRKLRIGSLQSVIQDLTVEVQTWIAHDCKRAVARPNRTTILTTTGIALLSIAMATCRPGSCSVKQTKAPVKACTESVSSPAVSLEPFTRPIVAIGDSH